MIHEDCFAFREVIKKKDGFKWQENKCDALTDFICLDSECPFYKKADTLIKYEYKINQTPGVGYKENEYKELPSQV